MDESLIDDLIKGPCVFGVCVCAIVLLREKRPASVNFPVRKQDGISTKIPTWTLESGGGITRNRGRERITKKTKMHLGSEQLQVITEEIQMCSQNV